MRKKSLTYYLLTDCLITRTRCINNVRSLLHYYAPDFQTPIKAGFRDLRTTSEFGPLLPKVAGQRIIVETLQ